jgi:AcrR family transcriptional regulator
MNQNVKSTILRAASRLFARYGFKKTSMDEIAQRARVSKATIYQHFSGKEEIFAVAVREKSEELVQSLIQAINSAETHEDKIRGFVAARISLIEEQRKLRRMSDEVLRENLPLVDEARQAFFNREVRLFQLVLEKGQEAGQFHLERPRQVALLFLSALRGLEVLLLGDQDTTEIQEGIDESLGLWIRGLLTAPASDS